MKTVYTVNGYSDFDSESVIGIFDSFDAAEKAMIKWNRESDSVLLEEVAYGKYKDHNSSSGEEYDYWIEPVKLNKKLS